MNCACGRELPPAWPRADLWGRPVCNACLAHEERAVWPEHAPEPQAQRTTEPKEA